MQRRLSYGDAVTLLGGSGPVLSVVERAVDTALSVGTLGLGELRGPILGWGRSVIVGLREQVRGLGRFSRTERLGAAHVVVVVTAFFEAFDGVPLPFRLDELDLTRGEQLALSDVQVAGGDWIGQVINAPVPAPRPECGYAALLADLQRWYAEAARRLADYVAGRSVWDGLDDSAQMRVRRLIVEELPDRAVGVYEDLHRRLALEVAEFGLWIENNERRATGVALGQLSSGLGQLEGLLREVGSGRQPDRRCRAIAAACRAELDQPLVAAGRSGSPVAMPTLGEIYVDPAFVVRAGGPADRPSEEGWWVEAERRTDLAAFLASYLTGTAAVNAPLLVLGQPGSGKSALTRVVAARLPAADFTPVRVALRDVPADAEIQDQIEHAIRSATGEAVPWPELVREAGDALPVVLLDGFDELLQATGVNRSDYLGKVAAFQYREAVQERPVAVVVTSRTAVADRAQLPDGSLVLRLEPFDDGQVERWLTVWNRVNRNYFAEAGVRPLPAAAALRCADLARQPLLLLMLALYDAQGNALGALVAEASASGRDAPGDPPLRTADLYERLLVSFAQRELTRLADPAPPAPPVALVESELTRLSIAAFGMFNRSHQWVTEAELDADLMTLSAGRTVAGDVGDFRAPLSPGQDLVGRFFFIQRAQARRDGQQLQTYEFLHSTFGEYLISRVVVQILHDLLARDAVSTLPLHPAAADDALLYALLSFAPLSSRGQVLTFLQDLLTPAAVGVAAVRLFLIDAFRFATTRRDLPLEAYQPAPLPPANRHVVYQLNLLLLALCCGEPIRAGELFPQSPDTATSMRHAALHWRAALGPEGFTGLVYALDVRWGWTNDRRDVTLRLGTGDEPVEPVDPHWIHEFGPGSWGWTAERRSGFSGHISVQDIVRSLQLRGGLGDNVLRHALEPVMTRMGEALTSFVCQSVREAESIARSLIELWLTSHLHEPTDQLITAYERAVLGVTGYGWGPGEHPDSRPAVTLLLSMMERDVHRLPASCLLDWLDTIVRSDRFRPEHAPTALACLSHTGAETESHQRVRSRLIIDLNRNITTDQDIPAGDGTPLHVAPRDSDTAP
jgi:hypothetical protein